MFVQIISIFIVRCSEHRDLLSSVLLFLSITMLIELVQHNKEAPSGRGNEKLKEVTLNWIIDQLQGIRAMNVQSIGTLESIF